MPEENKKPLYQRIAQELESEIINDAFIEKSIPSEVQLAERFKVNRHTIRKSIDQLVYKGMILRKRGVGLTVTHTKSFSYELTSGSRISTNIQNAGMHGESKLYKRYLKVADMKTANWLKCSPGTALLIVETIRYADGIPFAWVCHHFVYEEYPKIYQDFEQGSMHQFIQEVYDISLERDKTTITAIISDSNHMQTLNIPIGRPILKLNSLYRNKENKESVEYALCYLRGDMVELKSIYNYEQ